MLTHEAVHRPGVFDPGRCRSCAWEAGLLDHYDRLQREERRLDEAEEWARRAHRYARLGLWSSWAGALLAVFALLSG